MKNRYPDSICLSITYNKNKNVERDTYIPLELCNIFKQPISNSSDFNREIILKTAQKPPDRFSTIRNLMNRSGILQDKTLDNFGFNSLREEMIKLNAKLLMPISKPMKKLVDTRPSISDWIFIYLANHLNHINLKNMKNFVYELSTIAEGQNLIIEVNRCQIIPVNSKDQFISILKNELISKLNNKNNKKNEIQFILAAFDGDKSVYSKFRIKFYYILKSF